MLKKFLYRIMPLLFIIILIVFVMNGFSLESIIREFYHPRMIELKIDSDSLKKVQKVNIYLPPNYKKDHKYPVLYLLHGKDGNEQSWFNGILGINAAKIDQTADRLIKEEKIPPLIIVSPMIDNSYGINSSAITKKIDDHDIGLYEDYIMKELIPYIDSKYSTIKDKYGRYIGGISMGGFAALHLAFIHTDFFCKVGGHSAAIRADENAGSGIGWLFNNGNRREQIDPLYLADNLDKKDIFVYLDHGTIDHDWLVEGMKSLYTKLKGKHIDVQYVTAQGGHDYKYWSSQTERYLLFYTDKRE
ncbi:alpha/beta hydrolase [Heyndrickxia sp. NPDC080065]|uniref:alpha/beta hydrolase n=1 Tax=Heyndrickxia sp. NPDC080065 TaxID=3390568 RepID=UPI003D005945